MNQITQEQSVDDKERIRPFNGKTTAEEIVQDLDLRGKSILITGAGSGLGFETARVLAMRGARVFAFVRSLEKAEELKQKIQGDVEPVICELSDFDTVSKCAEMILKTAPRLDALVCNAGIMALPEFKKVQGLEMQFAVNYLSHFLLVRKLIPALEASGHARIVLVSSGLYIKAPKAGIKFEKLSENKLYRPFIAYAQSKLAMILFAREFAERFPEKNITANALYPGVIPTGLFRSLKGFRRTALKLLGHVLVFNKTPEQGAATQTFLAVHPSAEGISGKLFADCREVQPEGGYFADGGLQKKLWEDSMKRIQPYL